MAKGETIGTLRAYFAIVGVLGGALNAFALLARPLGLGSVFALAGIAVAGAFLFLGIRLKELIVTSPKLCEQIVIGAAAVVVLMAIANVLFGATLAAAQSAVWLLIAWYLVNNLRRLSAAAVSAPAPELGSER